MDRRYLRFCTADPLFYDSPDRFVPGGGRAEFTEAVARPHGWSESTGSVWRGLAPATRRVPEQGWKLHVTATPDNAAHVLRTVARTCVDEEVAFKHLPSRRALLARNAKYADRAESGKFITVYPRDPDGFEELLEELTHRLAGESGPCILGDLRIGDGPVHARYGGFIPLWTRRDGRRVPAIRRPDGTLTPDIRQPWFVVPEWVELPACLREHERARRSTRSGTMRYRVTGALHFSNGGGVYRAVRSDVGDPAWWPPEQAGGEIVLKEGRPHAGVDERGRDAVARVDHEYAMLHRLAGTASVPAVGAPFDAGGHRFLPQQLLPGVPLPRWVARHFPLAGAVADDDTVAGYTRRALAIADRVAETLADIHDRGVAFGDLHPGNVLVDDDDRVSLIDFELAADVDAPHHGAGAPGFACPAGGTVREADGAALAVLRLWLFQPTAPVLALSRAPLAGWIDHVGRRFPVPSTWTSRRRAELVDEGAVTPALPLPARPLPARRPPPVADLSDEGRTSRLCAALVAGIHATATPGRTDRLFPGDIRQFDVDGVCFGHGAAGVLHALHVAGADPEPGYERWLLDAVDRTPPRRPGFWEGAHGVAYVLDELGHREAADHVLDGVAGPDGDTADGDTGMSDRGMSVGLRDGGAGVGLVLLELAERRGDDRLHRRGVAVAEALAERSVAGGRVGLAGLLDGWSGAALLHVRAHEVTGDPTWLAHASRALDRDLEHCVPTGSGSLSVRDPEHGTTLPYLGAGSAGVALAAHAVATGAGPGDVASTALPALLAACRTEFVVHAGLAHGAAGLLYALRRTASRAGTERPDATRRAVDRHLATITRHLVPHGEGLVVAGHQLLRLSTDLATGSAGLLVALADPGHAPGLPLPGAGRAAPALVP